MVPKKSMRSFRLSGETQKQITLIAADLGINQTEAIEVAVQDFHKRLRSEEPRGPEQRMEERVFGPDEALARQHDRVADLYEADENLRPEFREAVSRLSRNTAKMLRGEEID